MNIKIKKIFLIVLILKFSLFTLIYPETKTTVMNETFSFKYKIPDNWIKVKLNNLDTDINRDIILDAYKPTLESLLIITGQETDFEFTADDWFSFILEAFSEDKTLTITAKGVGSFGKNRVVSVAIRGKGTGTSLNKGNIDTIRHIYLIPNGKNVIQFILTVPREKYTDVNKIVRETLSTLEFDREVINIVKEEGKPQITKLEISTFHQNYNIPEMKKLSSSNFLRIKADLLDKGIIIFSPEIENIFDIIIILPKSYKPQSANIFIPSELTINNEKKFGWIIPKNIINILDFGLFLTDEKNLGWIVPFKVITKYLKIYDDTYMVLLIDHKTDEGVPIIEFFKKNYSDIYQIE